MQSTKGIVVEHGVHTLGGMIEREALNAIPAVPIEGEDLLEVARDPACPTQILDTGPIKSCC